MGAGRPPIHNPRISTQKKKKRKTHTTHTQKKRLWALRMAWRHLVRHKQTTHGFSRFSWPGRAGEIHVRNYSSGLGQKKKALDETLSADMPQYNHEKSLYRRPLPPPAIAFSSKEGRQLFQEAMLEGTAESFFPLMEQFHTQSEPAFCGLSSLAMVLNALQIDPGKWVVLCYSRD